MHCLSRTNHTNVLNPDTAHVFIDRFFEANHYALARHDQHLQTSDMNNRAMVFNQEKLIYTRINC